MKTSSLWLLPVAALSLAASVFAGPADRPLATEGISVRNGYVIITKAGRSAILLDDVKLSNGTKVIYNGTVIMPDGSKTELREGDRISVDGTMSRAPSALHAPGPAARDPAPAVNAYVLRKDGQMIVCRNGSSAPMDTDSFWLHDGSTVTKDGRVTTADGRTLTLRDGDRISMEGAVTRASR